MMLKKTYHIGCNFNFLAGLLRLFVFVVMMLSIVCCKSKYDDCTEKDYASCDTERPEYGTVRILLTINAENQNVVVRAFEGDFEGSDLYWEKEYRSRVNSEIFMTEIDYSFSATYKRGDETIIAVDGGRVKISRYTMCEYTCYEAKVLEIDLRID